MKIARALLATVALIITACGTVYVVDPIIKTSSNKAYSWKECSTLHNFFFNLFCGEEDKAEYINPYSFNPAQADEKGNLKAGSRSLYQIASDPRLFTNTTSAREAKLARNILQNAILRVSRSTIENHLAAAKATSTNTNILFGASTAGLTAFGSIAAEATSRAVTAAATGTNAARSLFNEEVYRNNLVDTINGAVTTDLKLIRLKILDFQKKPIIEYDVEAAISDAMDYHQSGSFSYGMTLVKQSGERSVLQKQKMFSRYSSVGIFIMPSE